MNNPPITPSNLPLSARQPPIVRPSGREHPGFRSILAAQNAHDIEKEWTIKVNIPLKKVLDFFRLCCIGCFFGEHPELYQDHRTEHCPVSKVLMGFDPGLQSFRKSFDIPTGCCFGCGLSMKVSFIILSTNKNSLILYFSTGGTMGRSLESLNARILVSSTNYYTFTGI